MVNTLEGQQFQKNEEQPKKNIFQPFPFKGGFEQEKINDKGERIPLTDERMERLDHMLTELVKMFEGSDIKWAIDGGLSVSLLKGEYIGEHRDLDLAVENSQLEQLQKLIESKGFGLFVTLNTQSRETMVMKRVDAKEFSEAPTYLFWIVAVDDEGLIQKEKPLSFINVHIIKRNEQGTPIAANGDALPSEWFEPKTIKFKDKTINIVQPVKTAYYKLRSLRNYDLTDLRYLVETKGVSLEDVETIDMILQREARAKGIDFYPPRKEIIERMKEWLKE